MNNLYKYQKNPNPPLICSRFFTSKKPIIFFHANAVWIASPRPGKQPGCIAWQLLSSPQQCYMPRRSRNGLLVLNLIHICNKHSESTLLLYFDHIFSNVQFHGPYGMVSILRFFSQAQYQLNIPTELCNYSISSRLQNDILPLQLVLKSRLSSFTRH